MKTKSLKIFAVVLMAMTAFGTWGMTFSVGDYTYETQGSTNLVYCTGLTSAAQSQSNLSVTIPSLVSYNGTTYSVKGISANSFQNKTNIVSVTIRYGVNNIMAYAFQGCTGLTRVRLPSSIKVINFDVFTGCSALTTVYYAGFSFPKTVYNSAFPSNSNMNLYIPYQSRKTPAEYKAHSAFSKFANVSYSANAYDFYMTDGGTYCMGWPDNKDFSDVHSATLTGFPDGSSTTYRPTASTYSVGGLYFSIDTIGENAFQGQSTLKTIDLTNLNNLKFFDSQGANSGIQNVTKLVLPSSNFSFYATSFLRFESLTAFELASGSTKYSIYDGCFYNYNKSVLYKVPNAKTGEMDYPSTLKTVWNWSHANCTQITHAMLPYGVTSVSTGAFYNTTNLQYVRIPSSVTSLSNDRVFRDSKSTLWIICNMATPPTVMASTCFGDNSNMRLYVPYGKTSNYADAGWTGFYNVNYLGKQAYDSPDYSHFSNMIAYTVTSNASVTGADGNTYDGSVRVVCNGVTSYDNSSNNAITIPASVIIGNKNYVVNRIGEYAFNRPNSFTVSGCVNIDTIGANAFRDQAITSYAFTHNLYCIEDYAFYGSGLTGTVALPYGVARLGSYSFGNGKYSRIIVPNSIGSMYGNFCAGTTTLSELVLNKSGSVWYNYTGWDLTGVPSTCKILVPTGVVNQYKQNSKLSSRASYISAGAYDYAYGNNYDGKYFLTITSTSPVTFQNSTYAGKAKYVYHPNIQNSTSTGNYGFSISEEDRTVSTDKRSYLITEIGDSLLYGSKFTGGNIPGAVTRIGQSAFRNCAYAAHPLLLPDGLTFIGHDAFYGSKIAGEVRIPSTVTTLESYSLCTSTLNSIYFPDISVPTMGQCVWSQNIKYGVYVPNHLAHVYLNKANSWGTAYGNKIAVWINPYASTEMFSSVVPVDFSGTAVKAYYASAYNKNNTGKELTMTQVSKIPARTGVLLTNLQANSPERFDRPTGTVTAPSTNYLVGTPDNYVNIVDENVGYFWISATTGPYSQRFIRPTVATNSVVGSAYLKLNSSEASGKSQVFTNLFPATGGGGILGDVNGDGEVTAADVTALYDFLLNNDTSHIVNGDQTGDGDITAADVTAVYNVLLGN
ncbi:MAG: leucine-rich repeat protein [Muribaculaceae bacterium]|nr:leucine-rich repeat protein [Muribaculaceae bacterium]